MNSSWRLAAQIPSTRIVYVAALVIALLTRLLHVSQADFPLNDGGMTYVMIEDLVKNAFILPKFTSYNSLQIPFAYPPVPLYFGALLCRGLDIPLLVILQFAPAILSVCTFLVFVALARQLETRRAVVAAQALAFALISKSFVWEVMGAGLTRSFGMLMSVVTLLAVSKFVVCRSPLMGIFCGVMLGVTAASHGAAVLFSFVSIPILYVAFGELKRAFEIPLLYAAAFISSAPWWGTVIYNHGSYPFLAADQSVDKTYLSVTNIQSSLGSIAHQLLSTYSQPYLPVIGALCAVGIVQSFRVHRSVYALWWLLQSIVDARQGYQYAALPLALMIGHALVELKDLVYAVDPESQQADKRTQCEIFCYVCATDVTCLCVVCRALAINPSSNKAWIRTIRR